MHPAAWLDIAFGSEARVRILRALSAQPGRAWSERELATGVGMSPNATNRAVRTLETAGLVTVEAVGNAHAVRLAPEPGLVEALGVVFGAERRTWEETDQAIRTALPRGTAGFLFGSTVSGKAHGDSDVDILIVAKDRDSAVEAAHKVHRKVYERFPARLSVIALDAKEARRRMRRRGGFFQQATRDGVRLTDKDIDDVVTA